MKIFIKKLFEIAVYNNGAKTIYFKKGGEVNEVRST
jgi:hypothetical protein